MGTVSKGTCFVISPIGNFESDIRIAADKVLECVIEPALAETGYKALRADQISKPGEISLDIMKHLLKDPLVIADLSGRNANVFYELAIRHASRMPCIQIVTDGEELPFDVYGARTIRYDLADVPKNNAAIRDIKLQIAALEKDPRDVDTPLTAALNQITLRQSDDPQKNAIATLTDSLAKFQYDMREMFKELRLELELQRNTREYVDPMAMRRREFRDLLHTCNELIGSPAWETLSKGQRDFFTGHLSVLQNRQEQSSTSVKESFETLENMSKVLTLMNSTDELKSSKGQTKP